MNIETPEFRTTVKRLLDQLQPDDCESQTEYSWAREFHGLPLGIDLWSLMFLTPDGTLVRAGWEPREVSYSGEEWQLRLAVRLAAERFPEMARFIW